MRQVFRIREKLFFSALGGKDAQSLLILPFGVANAFRKQSFGISVSLQRTCNPKAVDILSEFGMGCLGCPSATMETLEQACYIHGLELEEVMNKLNA